MHALHLAIAVVALPLAACGHGPATSASTDPSSTVFQDTNGTDPNPEQSVRGPAVWTLAPTFTPDPTSTELELLVLEMACASGSGAVDRIVSSVEYGSTAVKVSVEVDSLGGEQVCPTNQPTPYLLQLDEPLGDRGLVGAASDFARYTVEPLPARLWVQPFDPSPVGMAAEVQGVLRYDASLDCFFLDNEGGSYPVVWPHNTLVLPGPVVVAPGPVQIEVGQTVRGGGGYVDVAQRFGIPVRCRSAGTEVAVYNPMERLAVVDG